MIKLAGFIPDKDIMIKIVGLRPREAAWGIAQWHFKTIPTYHDKIMIAEEIQDEYETLHTDIEELIGIANFWKWRYSCKNEENRSWI
jgi:FlaA1/EpsC-like NDP-sugar epimerase